METESRKSEDNMLKIKQRFDPLIRNESIKV